MIGDWQCSGLPDAHQPPIQFPYRNCHSESIQPASGLFANRNPLNLPAHSGSKSGSFVGRGTRQDLATTRSRLQVNGRRPSVLAVVCVELGTPKWTKTRPPSGHPERIESTKRRVLTLVPPSGGSSSPERALHSPPNKAGQPNRLEMAAVEAWTHRRRSKSQRNGCRSWVENTRCGQTAIQFRRNCNVPGDRGGALKSPFRARIERGSGSYQG
jgi:hypothetical protein